MQALHRPSVDRLLSTTRSVRRRLDLQRPVDEAELRDCIRLACYAPNASNAQRWRWLVLREPERKRAVAEHYRAGILAPMQALLAERRARGDAAGVRHSEATLQLAEQLERVPALVIPCFQGEINPESRYVDTATLFASILPAVWNFQLALHSRGLASTFTTAHLVEQVAVARLLGIPEGWLQACLIPVAYLRGDPLEAPQRRPVEEVIAWETWSQTGEGFASREAASPQED